MGTETEHGPHSTGWHVSYLMLGDTLHPEPNSFEIPEFIWVRKQGMPLSRSLTKL